MSDCKFDIFRKFCDGCKHGIPEDGVREPGCDECEFIGGKPTMYDPVLQEADEDNSKTEPTEYAKTIDEVAMRAGYVFSRADGCGARISTVDMRRVATGVTGWTVTIDGVGEQLMKELVDSVVALSRHDTEKPGPIEQPVECTDDHADYDSRRFAEELDVQLGTIREMLIEKNRQYGDSALNPVRVFSKASPREQLLVRIDDKISRLARGQNAGEDTVNDLLGYLAMLRILDARMTK